MIAPWLLYAIALGTLVGAAALGLSRMTHASRLPSRWIWLTALVIAVTGPFVANVFAKPRVAETGMAIAGARQSSSLSIDTILLVAWGATTTLLVARLVAGLLIVRRRRMGWREAALDGTPVLVTDSSGPALVGLARPRAVIPAWALTLQPRDRALILMHEAEHARARDPWLLAIGALSVAAMPWNPALWWLVRRLRLAVEIDCDARVLQSGADVRAYASLLLAVGERTSRPSLAGAAALAEPRSSLEQRILAMTSPTRPRRVIRTVALSGLAAAAVTVIACEAPLPDQIVSPSVAAAPTAGVVSVNGVPLEEKVRVDSMVTVHDNVVEVPLEQRKMRSSGTVHVRRLGGIPEVVEVRVRRDGQPLMIVDTVRADSEVRLREQEIVQRRAGTDLRRP